MAAHSNRFEFWSGAARTLPLIIAIAPFGILFGALAVDNGFTVAEAVLMSAAVYGGASQMVGIELFGQRVAPWLIVLSIFIVNARSILYSAAGGRLIGHWSAVQKALGFFLMVDPQYAETERRAERGRSISFAWYMGLALPIYGCWIAETLLGALFGRLIGNTHALGLDFLVPIYFLSLVMGFRQRANWLPVVVISAVGSMLVYQILGSPWHVTVGALVGVLLAAALPVRAA
ncbi:MAG TPA: AzlC family ABC transporter permease [Geminicoccus sp.]|jgi:predicted branched-subunit amino acid permease|uniref:AzlC family ABC transporter permease n=1 Tax=Geminicoccus sp. TaxID=2024832 RepID=UPI002E37D4AF|nr:AzlC family ABC transporter permease [Geminicoccus sp.]HEX2528423.1 AzlC family ABC transporter permease [Geminicoccus sp.]